MKTMNLKVAYKVWRSNKSNNDRYQYILPYYNFSRILNDNYFDGFINFASSGSNDLNNTNKVKSKIINDLSFTAQIISLI